jgi:hypothetical protein
MTIGIFAAKPTDEITIHEVETQESCSVLNGEGWIEMSGLARRQPTMLEDS